jgi:pimeloyl-ACP methyl ester carboxylesterase
MLHGDILTAEMFAPLIPALQSHYRLIIPERRGHGRAQDLPGGYTYGLFADDTIAFMDALGLRNVYLLGHSGGADMALMVAVSRPDLVSKLIFVSGESEVKLTEEKRTDILSQTTEEFRRFGPKVVEMYERATPDGASRFPLFFEKIKRLWAAEWKIPDEKLKAMSAKTLVMLGDHDFGTVEEAAILFRKIPRAELCVIPGAGHGLLWQKPEIIPGVILNFLRDG